MDPTGVRREEKQVSEVVKVAMECPGRRQEHQAFFRLTVRVGTQEDVFQLRFLLIDFFHRLFFLGIVRRRVQDSRLLSRLLLDRLHTIQRLVLVLVKHRVVVAGKVHGEIIVAVHGECVDALSL